MRWLPTLLATAGASALALFASTRKASASERAPGGSAGSGRLRLRTTTYWPFTAGESEKELEGGVLGAASWRGKKAIDPSTGKRPELHTLEDAIAGKVPYCSLSGDPDVWPFGQRIEIDTFPGIVFRVVDTGGSFKGSGKKYHTEGDEPVDICVLSKKTKVPETSGGRIVTGDNFEGGTLVAVSNLRGQNVTLVGYTILGAAGKQVTKTPAPPVKRATAPAPPVLPGMSKQNVPGTTPAENLPLGKTKKQVKKVDPQTIAKAQATLKAAVQKLAQSAANLKAKAGKTKARGPRSKKIVASAHSAVGKTGSVATRLLAVANKKFAGAQASQVQTQASQPRAPGVHGTHIGDDLSDAQAALQQAQSDYDSATQDVKAAEQTMNDSKKALDASSAQDPNFDQLQQDHDDSVAAYTSLIFSDLTWGNAAVALDAAKALVASLKDQPPPPPTPTPDTTPPSGGDAGPAGGGGGDAGPTSGDTSTPPGGSDPYTQAPADFQNQYAEDPYAPSSQQGPSPSDYAYAQPDEDPFADVPAGTDDGSGNNEGSTEDNVPDNVDPFADAPADWESETAMNGYTILGGGARPLVNCVQRGNTFAKLADVVAAFKATYPGVTAGIGDGCIAVREATPEDLNDLPDTFQGVPVEKEITGTIHAYTPRDHEALARAIESSCRKGTIEEKQVVGWVCRNRAAHLGTTISTLLAPEGYGPRGSGGRNYVSTEREPAEVSSQVAKVVLKLPKESDPTGGAIDFWNPGQQNHAKLLAEVQMLLGAEGIPILDSEEAREALVACGLRVIGHVGDLELLK